MKLSFILVLIAMVAACVPDPKAPPSHDHDEPSHHEKF
jgi:hypothetical protein